ncbi:hypothetical protein GCM10010924_46250 [Rhizobium wenxiniae]|nr:hypothetical protein GCM10010924_46250 [Rhizobium wenxiniae]
MGFIRSRQVHETRLGQRAVGKDNEILRAIDEVCGSPVGLDDPSLKPALEDDPITDRVGASEVESNTGEHVIQGALQRQAEHNRESAGGRNQGANREAENIGYQSQSCSEVYHADHEVLSETPLTRLVLEDEE